MKGSPFAKGWIELPHKPDIIINLLLSCRPAIFYSLLLLALGLRVSLEPIPAVRRQRLGHTQNQFAAGPHRKINNCTYCFLRVPKLPQVSVFGLQEEMQGNVCANNKHLIILGVQVLQTVTNILLVILKLSFGGLH